MERSKRHKLLDIISIAICSTICGMESFVEFEDYGKVKEDWLSNFLELPNGIPSHDTFRRVFSLLDPLEFQNCFGDWVSAICSHSPEDFIAIDGKTLRRSFDKASEQPALHLVSAWSSSNNFVLGQVAVDDKSNEITAIPKLLELIAGQGCTFTIDAMGCQKAIAKKIIEKKADYVFCLKQNNLNLYTEVEKFFEDPSNQKYIESFQKTEGDHGRIETRSYSSASAGFLKNTDDWVGVQSIVQVESEREVKGSGEISLERRFYISSLLSNAEVLAKGIRSHWSIENSLHWVLDVNFGEDNCRVREKVETENFAMLRRMAVGLLKQESSTKKSIRRKINIASLDNDYLWKVLQVGSNSQPNKHT